jgi:hypothetical protein
VRTARPIAPGGFADFIDAEGQPLEVLLQLEQLKFLMRGREGT